jgi:hypothetical protein
MEVINWRLLRNPALLAPLFITRNISTQVEEQTDEGGQSMPAMQKWQAEVPAGRQSSWSPRNLYSVPWKAPPMLVFRSRDKSDSVVGAFTGLRS